MTRNDTPDLEGCEAKFGRGKAHADELRAKVAEALDDYSYLVAFQRDEDASKYVFYIKDVPEADPAWSLIFGDAIHNFRATLDHLVVQLAILGQGRALTEDEIRSAEFPVLDNANRWQSITGPKGVQLLRSGERERIRELQPFNASDRSIWGRPALVFRGARIPRLLEALHAADIADKHRFVHPSWCAVKDVKVPPIDGIVSAGAYGQPLEADSELGFWSFDPGEALPDLPHDIDISRHFPLGVDFDWGQPMLEFAGEVEALVGSLIELFRPALTSGEPTPPVTTLL